MSTYFALDCAEETPFPLANVRHPVVSSFLLSTSVASIVAMSARKPKLLDQLRDVIRARHYSYRTEQTYTLWVRHFILFHDKRHPRDLGKPEIEAFLTYLAVSRHVSASTQNQAMSAILFLYHHVLEMEPDWLTDLVRAKPSGRVPLVLLQAEVKAVLDQLSGPHYLAEGLM